MYEADSLEIVHQVQFVSGDPYLNSIRQSWEQSVKEAFHQLPSPDWQRINARNHEDNWLSPSNIIPD
jgi:predicted proteasome-type protease